MTSYDNLTFINNNNFIGNDYLTKKFHENDKENKNNLNLNKDNHNFDSKNSQEILRIFSKKNRLSISNDDGKFYLILEIKDSSSPESKNKNHNYHSNHTNVKENCSVVLSDRKDLDETEKLNNSAWSLNSNGAISPKSTEISFKAKFKTEKCKFWDLNKNCKYSDNCAFAHGSNEVRQKIIPSANYKTKKCKQFFENGFCPYGSRCQFLHKDEDNLPFTYHNLLKSIVESGETKIDTNRRLKIFEKICQEKKTKKKSIEISIYNKESIYRY